MQNFKNLSYRANILIKLKYCFNKQKVFHDLNNPNQKNLSTIKNSNEEKIIAANSRKKYNKPPPIDLKSVRSEEQEKKAKPNSTFRKNAYALLTIPIVTFFLGVWQVKRREKKLELIDFLQKRTTSAPVELPKDPKELETLSENFEYQPFKVKGRFIHSKEIILTTRHDLTGTVQMPGGHAITPFLVSGRCDGLIILINRGYVPYTHYSPTKRAHAQIDSEVELTGLLRKNDVTNTFTPENKPPNEWHYRNVTVIARELGTSPIFLDANYESSIRGGPIGGQTNVNVKNDHFSYIITWFSLSVLTSILWWKRYSRAFL